MKKMAVAFLVLFSCTSEKKIKMESNFNVQFEGINEIDEFNIKDDTFLREYNDSTTVVKINLDSTEKAKIFNIIMENNIFKLPDIYEPESDCSSLPVIDKKLVVTNGNLKKVILINNCDYGFIDYYKVKGVRKSVFDIFHLLRSKESIKQIPKTDIVIF